AVGHLGDDAEQWDAEPGQVRNVGVERELSAGRRGEGDEPYGGDPQGRVPEAVSHVPLRLSWRCVVHRLADGAPSTSSRRPPANARDRAGRGAPATARAATSAALDTRAGPGFAQGCTDHEFCD